VHRGDQARALTFAEWSQERDGHLVAAPVEHDPLGLSQWSLPRDPQSPV
jgi:hypothetical protein